MNRGTRRTGGHRIGGWYGDPAHRRGSARRERAYVRALAQTDPLPYWRAQEQPEAAERDTVTIMRVQPDRPRSKPFVISDIWYAGCLTVAAVLGIFIGAVGCTDTGNLLPTFMYGGYAHTIRDGGVSDYDLNYPLAGRY